MPSLDKIIHERSRLLILTHLGSNEKKETSFNELKKILGFTSGNLSIQLKKLKAAGYVKIKKIFRDDKPYNTASITSSGSKALNSYLDEMEGLIRTLRK